MADLVLFENISAEDFLTAYNMHKQDAKKGYLPPENKLKDFKVSGTLKTRVADHRIDVFFLNQYDMLSDSTNHFIIFRTDSSGDDELIKLAKRFRLDLKSQGFPGLFRIDPRYGLVVGVAHDSVDSMRTKDHQNCFVTMYLTDDPSHPEVSLMEYTDKDNKDRYKDIFEKHNGCSPRKKGIFGFDLSSLKKKERSGEEPSAFNYKHIFSFINALKTRYSLSDIKLSFIFMDMTEKHFNQVLLDQEKGTFYPGGHCKFFNSTDELLN